MNTTDAPFLVGNHVLVCNHYWAAWQYPAVVTEVIPPDEIFQHTRYRVAFDELRYSPTVFSDRDLVHVEDVADENWMPDNETMVDEDARQQSMLLQQKLWDEESGEVK